MKYILDLTLNEYANNMVKLHMLAADYGFEWIEETPDTPAIYKRYILYAED